MTTIPLTSADEAAAARARGLCPTCYAAGVLTIMQPAGRRAWACPRQRDEPKHISVQALASVKATADQRVAFCPF